MDEVLAVGDTNFQAKCLDEFNNYKKQGKTVVLVTHSMEYVREYCNRTLVLDKGREAFIGSPERAIDVYTKLNAEAVLKEKTEEANDQDFIGNGKAILSNLKIVDNKGVETNRIESGIKFAAIFNVTFKEDVVNPTFGVMFKNVRGEATIGMHSLYSRNPKKISLGKRGETLEISFEGENILVPGNYTIMLAAASQESHLKYEILHLIEEAKRVNVFSDNIFWSPVNIPFQIKVKQK